MADKEQPLAPESKSQSGTIGSASMLSPDEADHAAKPDVAPVVGTDVPEPSSSPAPNAEPAKPAAEALAKEDKDVVDEQQVEEKPEEKKEPESALEPEDEHPRVDPLDPSDQVGKIDVGFHTTGVGRGEIDLPDKLTNAHFPQPAEPPRVSHSITGPRGDLREGYKEDISGGLRIETSVINPSSEVLCELIIEGLTWTPDTDELNSHPDVLSAAYASDTDVLVVTFEPGTTAFDHIIQLEALDQSDVDMSQIIISVSAKNPAAPSLPPAVTEEGGITLPVDAVADAPTLNVVLEDSNDQGGAFSGHEDGLLTISGNPGADSSDGSETHRLRIDFPDNLTTTKDYIDALILTLPDGIHLTGFGTHISGRITVINFELDTTGATPVVGDYAFILPVVNFSEFAIDADPAVIVTASSSETTTGDEEFDFSDNQVSVIVPVSPPPPPLDPPTLEYFITDDSGEPPLVDGTYKEDIVGGLKLEAAVVNIGDEVLSKIVVEGLTWAPDTAALTALSDVQSAGYVGTTLEIIFEAGVLAFSHTVQLTPIPQSDVDMTNVSISAFSKKPSAPSLGEEEKTITGVTLPVDAVADAPTIHIVLTPDSGSHFLLGGTGVATIYGNPGVDSADGSELHNLEVKLPVGLITTSFPPAPFLPLGVNFDEVDMNPTGYVIKFTLDTNAVTDYSFYIPVRNTNVRVIAGSAHVAAKSGETTTGDIELDLTDNFVEVEDGDTAQPNDDPLSSSPLAPPHIFFAGLDVTADQAIIKEDEPKQITVKIESGLPIDSVEIDFPEDFDVVGFDVVVSPIGEAALVPIPSGESGIEYMQNFTGPGQNVTVMSYEIIITPPEDSDVDFGDIEVKVNYTDPGSGPETVVETLSVVVDAVLDHEYEVTQSDEPEVVFNPLIADPFPAELDVSKNLLGFPLSGAGGEDTDGSEVIRFVSATMVNTGGFFFSPSLPAGDFAWVRVGGPTLNPDTHFLQYMGDYDLSSVDPALVELAVEATNLKPNTPTDDDPIGNIPTGNVGEIFIQTQEANTPEGAVPASGVEVDENDNTSVSSAPIIVNDNPSSRITLPELPRQVEWLKEDAGVQMYQIDMPTLADPLDPTPVAWTEVRVTLDPSWGNLNVQVDPGQGSVAPVVPNGNEFIITLNTPSGVSDISEYVQAFSFKVFGSPPEDADTDSFPFVSLVMSASTYGVNTQGYLVPDVGISDEQSPLSIVVDAVLDHTVDIQCDSALVVPESESKQIVDLNLDYSLVGAGFSHSELGGLDTDSSEVVSSVLFSLSPAFTGVLRIDPLAVVGDAVLTPLGENVYEITSASDSEANIEAAIEALQVELPAGFDSSLKISMSITREDVPTDAEIDPIDNSATEVHKLSISVLTNPNPDGDPDNLDDTHSLMENRDASGVFETMPANVMGNVLTNDQTPAFPDLDINDINYTGGGSVTKHTSTPGPNQVTFTEDSGIWTLVINLLDGSYTFTQHSPYPHAPGDGENIAIETFTYDVKGPNGHVSSSTADLTIKIKDDVPVAVDDENTVDAGQSVSGNVITGANQTGVGGDTGKDDPGADIPSTLVDVNGTPVVGETMIAGTYGTLTILPDGSYSYLANPQPPVLNPATVFVDTFAYTMEDDDMDSTGADLNITVQPSVGSLVWNLQGPDEVAEGDAPCYTLSYSGVTLLPGETVSINLLLALGTAESEDFVQAFIADVQAAADLDLGITWDGTTVTFDATVTDFIFYLPTVADLESEGPEVFVVSLEAPSHGVVNNGSIDTTIIDDDVPSPQPDGVGDENLIMENRDASGVFETMPANLMGNVLTNDQTPAFPDLDINDINYTGGGSVSKDTSVPNQVTFTEASGIWTLVINLEYGSYTFTQHSPYPHAPGDGENIAIETFTYDVKGPNGHVSSSTADLTIKIKDDVPVAVDDENTVDAGQSVSGNVITGANQTGVGVDTGKDDPGADIEVKVVDENCDPLTEPLVLEGDHGTLTLNADGSYTYQADPFAGAFPTTTVAGGYKADLSDWSDDGITFEAYNFGTDPITEAEDGTVAVDDDGLGVDGGSPVGLQVNHNSVTGETESLKVLFPEAIDKAVVTLTHLFNDENDGEVGMWVAYAADGTTEVGRAVFGPDQVDFNGSNNVGTIEINPALPFHSIVFSAEPYGSGQNDDDHDDVDDDSSDYFVNKITYTTVGDLEPRMDHFDYMIIDDDGDKSEASLWITVTPGDAPNRPPEEEDDAATTDEDTPVSIDVLDNDGDPDGDPITLESIVTGPLNGTVEIDDNGTPGNPDDDFLTYTPDADFSGFDTLIYKINDGNGEMDTAEVTITVLPVAGEPALVVDCDHEDELNFITIHFTLGDPTDTDETHWFRLIAPEGVELDFSMTDLPWTQDPESGEWSLHLTTAEIQAFEISGDLEYDSETGEGTLSGPKVAAIEGETLVIDSLTLPDGVTVLGQNAAGDAPTAEIVQYFDKGPVSSHGFYINADGVNQIDFVEPDGGSETLIFQFDDLQKSGSFIATRLHLHASTNIPEGDLERGQYQLFKDGVAVSLLIPFIASDDAKSPVAVDITSADYTGDGFDEIRFTVIEHLDPTYTGHTNYRISSLTVTSEEEIPDDAQITVTLQSKDEADSGVDYSNTVLAEIDAQDCADGVHISAEGEAFYEGVDEVEDVFSFSFESLIILGDVHVVQNFDISDGDVIDLSALLADLMVDTDSAALADILDFALEGDDTVVTIMHEGLGGVPVDHEIRVENTNFIGANAGNDMAIIQDLIDNGTLQVDNV